MADTQFLIHQLFHKICGRMPDKFSRSVILLNFALVHDKHLCAKLQGLGNIVGHEEHGDARLLVNPAQLHLKLGARQFIHGSEGLIHQKDFRRSGKSPGNAHTLLLASGQL